MAVYGIAIVKECANKMIETAIKFLGSANKIFENTIKIFETANKKIKTAINSSKMITSLE
ncbi:hypothetical protein ACFWM3_09975 [Gottfriedia sp. NPDC058432]|uniref:hypothetical protein n=1 Tax=Gottfriedia sp. NPDC058432 TaxID=3346497 RepID=UPI00366816B1